MTSTPERYLVVGGCGFVGRHIVTQLLAEKASVSVLDLQQRFFDKEVDYYTGDLTSESDVSNVFSKAQPSVIIHTASPIPAAHMEEIMWKVNLEGTKTLVNVAKQMKIRKFVYTSSSSVIFDGTDLCYADETWPYPEKHFDAYNASKAAAEEFVIGANSRTFKTVALRPSGIFGPGDRQAIPGFVKVLKDKRTNVQIGNNLNLNDYTYVGNVAYAHILAAKRIDNDGVAGEVFIITNDEPMYWWDFPRALWAEMGHVPTSIIAIPRPVGMALAYASETFSALLGREALFTRFRVTFTCVNRYFNITKAKTVLGYEPQTSIKEGLRLSVESLKEQPESK